MSLTLMEGMTDEDLKGIDAELEKLGVVESGDAGAAAETVATVATGEDVSAPAATSQAPVVPEPVTPLKIDGLQVYLDDKPVEDLRGVSIEDLLTKATLGYKALGAEQKKAFKDVIRVAQLGHLNEKQQGQLREDVATLSKALEAATTSKADLERQAGVWTKAMQKAAMGDTSLLERMIEDYRSSLLSDETQPSNLPNANLEAQLAGQKLLNDEIRPWLQTVAESYGFQDVAALERYALAKINEIPRSLLTAQRLSRYLSTDLLEEIEAAGYVRQTVDHQAQAQPRNELGQFLPGRTAAPVNNLQSEVEALKAQLAQLQANSNTARLNNAPPGTGSAGAVEGIEGMPSFGDNANAAEMMEWLRKR